MSIQAGEGPVISWGQNPPVAAGAAPDSYSADRAPSANDLGAGLIDPRFGYKMGGGGSGASSPQGSPLAYQFGPGVNYVTTDQVPAVATTANIAALANAVSGTAMVLVSATGAGVTVMTAAQFIQPTGNTVPACLALDGQPAFKAFGQSGAIQAWDPTTTLARAVSITGVSGGAGGAFAVVGYDIYGNLQHETITAAAGVATTNGKKAFKFIQSVTPGFADAHNYSVGTTDIYGLMFRTDSYGYVNATFNNAPVTAPTFLAAVTTTPTATSGDTRGTIVVTSDGTKRLQVMQGISIANLAAVTPGDTTPIFGRLPFAA